MRRRSAASVPFEQMDKGTGKNQQNRLCLLASLSAFFWILLLYFHFAVLGSSNNVDESVKLESHPLNTESKTPSFVTDARLENAPSKNTPLVDASSKNTPSSSSSGKKAENFQFMRALRTIENKTDPCGGKYIYVHDLPPRSMKIC
ncbi:hypothetical protein RCOM_0541900 [Ricinus communis]|uniref:Exostosin GT47 domain-containing protein n=1 Tax=Ricinus communis TaxID=3988 RepID=B9SKL6_RICCO|nr:hypothetical protein RCOM_0541900 [Ricinus communis]